MRDDGIKYEEYCCEYLQERGYSTKTTVASGDQGADIIAEKDGIRIAVQCKYRTEGSVGNDAIQQALAGKMYYDCDLALVITNVDFTPKAITAAQKLKVKTWSRVEMKTDDEVEYIGDDDIENSDTYERLLELLETIEELKAEEENKDPLLSVYETTSPFIYGAVESLSDFESKLVYGNTLLSQRFHIKINLNEDLNSNKSKLNEFEKEYFEGYEEAQKLLRIINYKSNMVFYIVDWFSSDDCDKKIFVFESAEILNAYFKSELQEVLNNHYSNVIVDCPTRHSIVVSIISIDKNRTDRIDELVNYISEYVSKRVSRSWISVGSDNDVQYEPIDNVSAKVDGKDITEDFETFYLFSSRERIDDSVVTALEEEIKTFFKYRVLLRKHDDHRLIMGIKKVKGLDNTLSIYDVHNFYGHDYSKMLSISTGMIDEYFDFTVRLNSIDISDFANLIDDEKCRVAITAYLQQIQFYVLGIYDFAAINLVKDEKLEVLFEKGIFDSGELKLNAKRIRLKIVDSNNKLVSLFYRESYWDNTFPLYDFKYVDFMGNSSNAPIIGLNVMMIQKMFSTLPDICKVMGGYYIVDTVNEKLNEYMKILNGLYDSFVSAYSKMELCQCEDENITRWIEEDCILYYYGVPFEDKRAYAESEYGYINFLMNNYFLWKIAEEVPLKNVVWGIPHDYTDEPSDESNFRGVIEKCLKDNHIRYDYLDKHPHSSEIYYYRLHGKVEIDSVISQMNKLVSANQLTSKYHIYGYKREFGVCAFVSSNFSFDNEWYNDTYLPIQNIENNTKFKSDISMWLIEASKFANCVFEPFVDRDNRIALLSVRLNRVNIKNLETAFTDSPSGENQLWGNWNDFVYSLYSLNSYMICKENLSDDETKFRSIVKIYDSNGIIIAELTGDDALYLYLHDILPVWPCFIDAKLKQYIEKFNNDIIPILNKSLQQSIQTLEEISADYDSK